MRDFCKPRPNPNMAIHGNYTFSAGYDDEHKYNNPTFDGLWSKIMGDRSSKKTPARQTPEIICRKDSQLGKYFIEVNGETQTIDRSEWENMVRALGINSFEEFKSRFPEVCRYFIIQAQYVPFEEVKN